MCDLTNDFEFETVQKLQMGPGEVLFVHLDEQTWQAWLEDPEDICRMRKYLSNALGIEVECCIILGPSVRLEVVNAEATCLTGYKN